MLFRSVQGVVQGVDGQVCWPVELDLINGQGANTWHGFPCGAVVLVPSQGVNDAKLVHHSDIVAIGNVDLALRPNSNAYNKSI